MVVDCSVKEKDCSTNFTTPQFFVDGFLLFLDANSNMTGSYCLECTYNLTRKGYILVDVDAITIEEQTKEKRQQIIQGPDDYDSDEDD